jgi:hypothetical protein
LSKQVPRGHEDINCHRCLPERVPMSEVCHKCSLWQELRGRDPNTGEETSEWRCVDAWLLIGQLEIAKMVRSGAVATETFRNEVVALNMASLNAAAAQPTPYQPHSQIQGQRPAVLIESQPSNIVDG